MDSFSVDAVAAAGCVTDKVPFQAIPVPLGETYEVELFAKAQNSSDKQGYILKVYRLEGVETELQALHIPGTSLTPGFSKKLRSYEAKLALGEDFISLHYVLLDTRQKVRFSAEPQRRATGTADVGGSDRASAEEPQRRVANASTGANGSASAARARRLDGPPDAVALATGEAQYLERSEVFPVDHGHSRRISISVTSADDMDEYEGTYLVTVSRAGCNIYKPIYDPDGQACVINCGQSFYRSPGVDRCARCNSDCKICSSLLHCELCRPDTSEYNYAVRPDGSCQGTESSLLAKYFWWCASVAMFAALLFLMGLVMLCQCLCSCCCTSGREKLGVGSDSDGEMQSQRTLS